MVGTKAFMISIVMTPVLMFAGLIAMELFTEVGQTKRRTIAVIDHSGEFIQAIELAAKMRTGLLEKAATTSESDEVDEESIPGVSPEIYIIEPIDSDTVDDDLRFELSQRVRNQDLYAFVEIPADALDVDAKGDNEAKYFAQDSSISLARRWIAEVISTVARQKRLTQSGLQPDQIAKFNKYNQGVFVAGRGLMKRTADGGVASSEERNVMITLFLPMGIMMLMFMVIFMASQPMLESVLEEKSQRIAEVLLGSANPFQLMMGKLFGTVAGSLTIFTIYLLGIYGAAVYRGWTEFIPLEIVPWFVVFQITGVLFYAAIFMAVGASVSQLKEAQSLLLPVWTMLMAPLFVWIMIVRDPQGPLALVMSFMPPTASTTMVLRLATGQAIAWWQPALALLVTLLATIVVVIIAGRIFRVGILWQGKTPRLSEIMKWALIGE